MPKDMSSPNRQTPSRGKRATLRSSRRGAKAHSRRGVLLLITLTLLVLFLMIGTAFVITAKQSQSASRAANTGQLAQTAKQAQGDLLQDALRQLIRGTDNVNSVLRDHDLLGDMYGNDGFRCQVANVRWANDPENPTNNGNNAVGGLTAGQFVQFELAAPLHDYRGLAQPLIDDNDPIVPNLPSVMPRIEDALNGQVVTFISGGATLSARNVSTRIVDYLPVLDETSGELIAVTLTVMAFPLANGDDLLSVADTSGLDGSRIVVNGRPYNGTGVGYDRLQARVGADNVRGDASETIPDGNRNSFSAPIALTPNPVYFGILADASSNPATTATTLQPALGNYLGYSNVNAFDQADFQAELSKLNQFQSGASLAGQGGADESYDAADFQNMALAFEQPPGSDPDQRDVRYPDLSTAPPTSLFDMPIPSFHRPALINYWRNRTDANLASTQSQRFGNPMLLRKILLRPNWVDHPNFDGSNPELSVWMSAWQAALETGDTAGMEAAADSLLKRMVYGPWDVDTDGDGVRDSVWIDFGASVMTNPDGKLVKPLAAIKVIDLDSKINVNAHGTLDLAGFYSAPQDQQLKRVNPTNPNAITTADLPRGMGMGPADISLRPLFSRQEMTNLLRGEWNAANNAVVTTGRYGVDLVSGGLGGTTPDPRPGLPGFDTLAQMKLRELPDRSDGLRKINRDNLLTPDTVTRQRTYVGGVVSPIDLRARYSVGVNPFGQPIWESISVTESTSETQRSDSPYEANVLGTWSGESRGAADALYSLAELERVYRAFDVDAPSLPNRLWDLGNMASRAATGEHQLVTTESTDLPVPNVGLPENMRQMVSTNRNLLRPPRSIAELMEIRVRYALRNDGVTLWPEPYSDPTDADRVRDVIRRILAPELAAGTRMNVNRAFGNGVDDNSSNTNPGFGVVDEPWPPERNSRLWSILQREPSANDTSRFDAAQAVRNVLEEVIFPATATEVLEDDRLNSTVPHRALYARHLYCLAMLLTTDENHTGLRQQDENRARRIAQWAINVAEFKDPDSIMTHFEYDTNPFDGWDVDGSIATPQNDSPDDSMNFRGLVWGCERPELVLTETLAWHDRRTEDHANDDPGFGQSGPVGSNQNDDRNLDSPTKPFGAAFIEIYNPWPMMPSANSDTHARTTVNNGGVERNIDGGVDIAAVAGPPNGIQSPVWRLTVYKDGHIEGQPLRDPDNPDRNLRPEIIDRSVYFAGFDPEPAYRAAGLPWQDDGVAFFNNVAVGNDVPPVRPGRYLVVGSGEERLNNPGVYEAPLVNPLWHFRRWSNRDYRRIELEPRNNNPRAAKIRFVAPNTPAANVSPPFMTQAIDPDALDIGKTVCDVALIDRVNVNGAPAHRRFSLTEPASGYPDNIGQVRFVDPDGPGGQIGEYMGAPDFITPKPVGLPLDDDRVDGQWSDRRGGTLEDGHNATTQEPFSESRLSLLALAANDDGIIQNFSTIYLQRLANPLAPYDRDLNPYITVDSISANVTAFNGSESPQWSSADARGGGQAGGRLNDVAYQNGQAIGIRNNRPERIDHFASFERGENSEAAQGGGNVARADVSANLWLHEPPSGQQHRPHQLTAADKAVGGGNQTHNFNGIPKMTLGWVNDAFVFPRRDRSQVDPNNPTLGQDQVTPAKPFPWIVWNDRPFVSANELMLVPASRPGRLLAEFSRNRGDDPYDVDAQPNDDTGAILLPTFGHLMPFMDDSQTPDNNNPYPTGMYRTLEYLQTPSLFVGTEQWLNPGAFNWHDTGSGDRNVDSPFDPRTSFLPPFNSVSTFRDPGRVNVNTITSAGVWNCIEHDYSDPGAGNNRKHLGPTWSRNNGVAVSRRGYQAGSLRLLTLNNNIPTFFANPFRSPDAGALVPLDTMVRQGVECTLLRSTSVTNTPDNEPLFNGGKGAAQRQGDPTDPDNPQNVNRHAAMYFAPMTRLDNLLTTRSHVYAIWITVGFFEVEEAPDWQSNEDDVQTRFDVADDGLDDVDFALYQRAYPEGYMLGKEAGIETGEDRRLRGFYVIDRSLPVGYETGIDHNVENLIRLQRRIE